MKEFDLGTQANEIVEGLFLAGERYGANRDFARSMRIRLVVCCNALPEWPTFVCHDGERREYTECATSVEGFVEALSAAGPRADDEDPRTFIYNIPADDSPMFDLSPWFQPASDVLAHIVEGMKSRALVHCLAGVSRSATIVSAYLMRRTRLPTSDVVGRLQKRRRVVNPNAGFRNQLERWELLGYTHFGAGQVDAAARQIATRLTGLSQVAVHRKLKSFFDALLPAAGSTEADRASIGIIGKAVDEVQVVPWPVYVSMFVDAATALFDGDEAVDCPALPSRVSECLGYLGACDPAVITPKRWRELTVSVTCGMGDQLGFEPYAVANWLTGLRRIPATAIAHRCEAHAWVHIFAARIRTVLEAGTPMAFPPLLRVDFGDLNLQQTDDWTPALLPCNTRRVLRTSLRSLLAEAGLDASSDGELGAASSVLLRVLDAMVDGTVAETAEALRADIARLPPVDAASVFVALRAVGDDVPAAVLSAFESEEVRDAIDGAAADARSVFERCAVDPSVATFVV